MAFQDVLKQLVAGVDGASGAILLECAGEAIAWHSVDGNKVDRLRLRGAYVAVALQNSRALATRTGLGQAEQLVLQYDGASFIAQAVERDYFIVVELQTGANIGQAIFRLQPMLDRLRRELDA